MHTHRRVGRAKAVKEKSHNTTDYNEADTNADKWCLGRNFTPIAYTNRSADLYPYSEAYEPIENVPIVSGDAA